MKFHRPNRLKKKRCMKINSAYKLTKKIKIRVSPYKIKIKTYKIMRFSRRKGEINFKRILKIHLKFPNNKKRLKKKDKKIQI